MYFDRVRNADARKKTVLEETLSKAANETLQVIELGCGCGIAGIAIKRLWEKSKVVLTDLPAANDIASRNIAEACAGEEGEEGGLAFVPLNWEEDFPASLQERNFDIILATDCTYNPDSAPYLARTISGLISQSPRAIVVVAMKVRHPSEAVFFDHMAGGSIRLREKMVLRLPQDERWESEPEEIEVYTFQREEVISAPEPVRKRRRVL